MLCEKGRSLQNTRRMAGWWEWLNQGVGVSAFADVVEVIRRGHTAASERVTVSQELDTAQRCVDTFAEVVVLRPDVDYRVDVATGVRTAISLDEW